MRILINLSTSKVGGAQSVALHALQALRDVQESSNLQLVLIVPKGSAVARKAIEGGFRVHKVSRRPLLRFVQEFFLIWFVHFNEPLDVVYNYWHYVPLMPCFSVQNSADSNIYYPELEFWNSYRGLDALLMKFKDAYRMFGVSKTDLVFVENKAIYKRLVKLKTHGEVRYIAPSVDFVMMKNIPERVRIFGVLSGWQPNKNIDVLPFLAKEIKSLGVPVEFHLSLDKGSNSSYAQSVYNKIEELGVMEMFKFRGTINKKDLPDFYESVDAIFLLSNLESFSNNIAESWAFSRPIVLQDVEWARAVCESSGYYMGLKNLEKEALRLVSFCNNKEEIYSLVMEGRKNLNLLNTHAEKLQKEINYIECLRVL